jgi:hypothetical protein
MINRFLILCCAVFLVIAPACYALEDEADGPVDQPCKSQECVDADAGYKYAQEHKVKEAKECVGHSEAYLSGCEDWLDEQDDADDDESDHTHLPPHDADDQEND